MSKPYRPSNGTEGDYFCSDFCFRCKKYPDEDNANKDCDILARSFWYDIDDPKYPTEWIVDDDGLSNPRCTAFEEKA
jgi:hypothetical protein